MADRTCSDLKRKLYLGLGELNWLNETKKNYFLFLQFYFMAQIGRIYFQQSLLICYYDGIFEESGFKNLSDKSAFLLNFLVPSSPDKQLFSS